MKCLWVFGLCFLIKTKKRGSGDSVKENRGRRGMASEREREAAGGSEKKGY